MTKKKGPAGAGKAVARLKEKQAQREAPATQPMIQAMVWYREEDYAPLLSIFDDGDLLPPTYRDWLGRAEEKKSEIEAAGGVAIVEGREFVVPDDVRRMLVPCGGHRVPLTAEAELEQHTARTVLERVAASVEVPH